MVSFLFVPGEPRRYPLTHMHQHIVIFLAILVLGCDQRPPQIGSGNNDQATQLSTKPEWTTFSVKDLNDAISKNQIVIVNFGSPDGGKMPNIKFSNNEIALDTEQLTKFFDKHNVVLMRARLGENEHPPGLRGTHGFIGFATLAIYASGREWPDRIVAFPSEGTIKEEIESLGSTGG